MTFMTMIGVLAIGLVTLLIGLATKKRWVTYLSVVPLAISLWNLAFVFSMGV